MNPRRSRIGRSPAERSIAAIKVLNALGYGREGAGLTLDLVYNPQGPSLPPSQQKLEADYKRMAAAVKAIGRIEEPKK